MTIINFFDVPDREHWWGELQQNDWVSGKLLCKLIREDTFFETLPRKKHRLRCLYSHLKKRLAKKALLCYPIRYIKVRSKNSMKIRFFFLAFALALPLLLFASCDADSYRAEGVESYDLPAIRERYAGDLDSSLAIFPSAETLQNVNATSSLTTERAPSRTSS